jgi:hypothetical protein
VFQSSTLSVIFGPKKEEITENCRKFHELHNLSSTCNISVSNLRRLRWAGHIARVADMRNACSICVRYPEGKRRLGRPKHRRINNKK